MAVTAKRKQKKSSESEPPAKVSIQIPSNYVIVAQGFIQIAKKEAPVIKDEYIDESGSDDYDEDDEEEGQEKSGDASLLNIEAEKMAFEDASKSMQVYMCAPTQFDCL